MLPAASHVVPATRPPLAIPWRHQGHGFVRQLVGGDDQVGFVLAVEVVEQDDGDTRPGRGQCCCNAAVQVWAVESVSID
jgi:hypothetical protein